jgi:maleylpyruvate isomerase
MRTREVWVHAVDLDNGATFTDIPAPVLARLLKDITSAWHTRGTDTGLVIKVTDQPDAMTIGDTDAESPLIISGTLAAVAQWATGRGTSGVTATGNGATREDTPAAPKWI